MGIGLKETVDQDHLEHGIRSTRCESLAIEARVVNGRQIVAADALDVLLHIHRAARPFPVDAWHEHAEITGKIAGEAFGVSCLYCEIELSLQLTAQLAYNLHGPVAPGLADARRRRRLQFAARQRPCCTSYAIPPWRRTAHWYWPTISRRARGSGKRRSRTSTRGDRPGRA